MKKVWLIVMLVGILAVAGLATQTLTVLMPIGGGYTIESQEVLAKGFEQTHPGVKINMEFVGWANLWNKIVTSFGANNAPDVMYIASRWIPALASMGALTPLENYITVQKEHMYYPSVWSSLIYDGHYWGVPRAMSTKVFIYNKKLFKENGITKVPTNWDELLADAKKIYNPKKGVYGILMAGKKFVSTVTQFEQYLCANGGAIVDPKTGKVEIDSPQAIKALEFYKELSKYAQPGITNWTREDLIKLFEAGKGGMYIDHVHNALKAMKAGIDVGFFPIPGGPDSNAPYSTVVVVDCIAMSSQTKNKELAWEFMNYMSTLKEQTRWDTLQGFVPPMIKEAEEPEFQKWYWKPYIQALKYGHPQAAGIKDWVSTANAVLNAIQSVLLNQTTPQEALKKAAQTIEILQK